MLVSAALAAAFARSAAAGAAPTSLLPVEPEAPAPAAALAPLAKDSVWTPRFQAAAGELAAALRPGDEARWGPPPGGKWLGAAGRARISSLLGERDSPFRNALFAEGLTLSVIHGRASADSMSSDRLRSIAGGGGG